MVKAISLQKLFNIYPGEGRSGFQFALLGFLWAVAVSLGWKNADALFLLNVGSDSLPMAYGIIACFMICIAFVMIYAFNTYAVHRIFLTILGIGIVFYSGAFVYLKMGMEDESKVLWYALRIFGWIFFSIVNTSYWTFLDQFYHLRDAKRLFSLFASAIFLGLAITGLTMRTGFFEFTDILVLIVGILFITIGWILRIVKNVQPIHGEHDIDTVPSSKESFAQMIKSITRSKFTLFLMVMNFLIYVSVVLTEYNYMVAFQDIFGGGFDAPVANEEDAPLTLFLGQCIAIVSIFNLIFGLFIYSRLIRRFGVGGMLTVTPMILVITYIGWPFSGALLFPLMAFFVSESTLYVIDDNNFNLLLNAVPSKLKYKIRVFIESFFEPFGTLVSALLLSTSWDSKGIALGVALILLMVSLIVKTLYSKAIYSNLMENTIHFNRTPKEWLPTLSKKERKRSETRLLAILKLGNPKSIAFAIEGLLDFEDLSIVDKLLAILDQTGESTREIFIQLLEKSPTFSREPRIIEKLLTWDQALQESSEISSPFKSTLHLFLAKQGLLSPQKALSDLKSHDLKLQGAALIAFKKSAAFTSLLSNAELRTVASEHLQELLDSQEEAKVLMGLKILTVDAGGEDVNVFLPYLSHPSLLVARQAALSIAEIATEQSSHHIGFLITSIQEQSDNEFRLSLLNAIGQMANTSHVKEILISALHFRPNEKRMVEKIISQMGLRTIPTLLSIVKDTSLHDKCRLLAGRILGKLSNSQLKTNLYPIMTEEIDRAFFYFYHYHTIEEDYPGQNLKVLKDGLLSSFHSVMDFMIQLLGTAGEIEDSELLSKSLRSENPKVRSQVVETLEKTCDPAIFRLLQPLVDELPLPEKLRYYGKERLSLEELLEKLSNSSSLVDQIAAAAIAATLSIPGWKNRLKLKMRGSEPLFNHFAYELLE